MRTTQLSMGFGASRFAVGLFCREGEKTQVGRTSPVFRFSLSRQTCLLSAWQVLRKDALCSVPLG